MDIYTPNAQTEFEMYGIQTAPPQSICLIYPPNVIK